MNEQEIERIALANGFKLKQQPGGSMALNPYVFEFARALLAAPRPEVEPLAKLAREQEPLGKVFEDVLYKNLHELYESDPAPTIGIPPVPQPVPTPPTPSDELRKAAREALRVLDLLGSGPTADNLRAVLDKLKS